MKIADRQTYSGIKCVGARPASWKVEGTQKAIPVNK